MATDNHFVNFNLRSPSNKKSAIHVIVRWKGIRWVGNSGHSIETQYWNKKARPQKAKDNLPNCTAEKKKVLKTLNRNLDSIKVDIDGIFESYLETKNRVPAKEEFIREYTQKKDKADSRSMTLLRFIDEVMPYKTFSKSGGSILSVSPETVRNYKQAARFLREFSDAKYPGRAAISFEGINKDFYANFVSWMQTKEVAGRKDNSLTGGKDSFKGHTANFIGKIISNLKSIMNYAVEKGYTDNTAHREKSFKAPVDDGIEHIYLSVEQLDEMWELTFADEEKHLERARDLFMLSAWTGLRFSDLEEFNRLARFDAEGTIKIVTQKTKQEVTIPIIRNSPVPAILAKYEEGLPTMSNQKANQHIKKVAARMDGFDIVHTLSRTEGGLKETRKFLLSEMVSFHTSRRSYATNMVETFGISPFKVMKMTGHKKIEVFENYIKTTSAEAANDIAAKVNAQREKLKVS